MFCLGKIVNLKQKIIMRYVVMVAYDVLPEKRLDFFDLVQQEANALVDNELHTIHVSSMVEDKEKNRFVNLKVFENKEAYLEHLDGEILKAFLEIIKDMIVSGPTILFEGVKLLSRDDFSLDENPLDPKKFLQ